MEEIKLWILNQQEKLDLITANACKDFWEAHKGLPNFGYDLKKTHRESYELVNGRDLCYDRPTTALTYTLWYHPRRINTFLSFFLDRLIGFSGQKIQVFDLGAGTGAVQWAILLVAYGLKKFGKVPPSISFVNIDTSPFMLYFNRDYLWQHFLRHYDQTDLDVRIEYTINSWNNEYGFDSTNTIIASSYLFDATDNREHIKQDFVNLVEKYHPSTLMLLTSKNKREYLDLLSKDFNALGYGVDGKSSSTLLYNEPLQKINGFRKELAHFYPDVCELNRSSSWRDPSYYGVIINKFQTGLSFSRSRQIKRIDLFSPPIRVIKEVKLNEKQKAASAFSIAPSVIIGPAGCGKSIVISEKCFNTVKEYGYNKNLKILITTFNKPLIDQLSSWLYQLLDLKKTKKRIINNVVNFFFEGSTSPNITLLHIDILPLRIGAIPYNGNVNNSQHIYLMDEFINEVKKEEKISDKRYDNFLNAEFLLEEYHRVIYGLEVGITDGEKTYQNLTRVGRGNNPRLPKNGNRRRIVFSILRKYAFYIHKNKIDSFTIRRQLFLADLKKMPENKKYDYIFVDEFQDCTRADFKIFSLLLKDPDHFCVAGDLAQAVHIGKAARIPRFVDMAKRKVHKLDGSYRLPVRISEAIKPISEAIRLSFNNNEGVSVITPFKGSPPGARPIVVYASKIDQMVSKISEIFRTYSVYDIEKVTILEKDKDLSDRLKKSGIKSETDTILRLKGLEKRCIIWSTRAHIVFKNEVFEFVYTILSRTSAILIIALSDSMLEIYKSVIGKLNPERLILWDSETASKFSVFRHEAEVIATIDE